MDFNLFLWIRQGVKQSVLLGVSDAIETIGTPDNAEDITPRLLDFMRTDSSGPATKTVSRTPKRKRLGKSLRDLESTPEA